MKKERTHYYSLLKENAVKLSYKRKDVSGLARELGVSAPLLYFWREEYVQYNMAKAVFLVTSSSSRLLKKRNSLR